MSFQVCCYTAVISKYFGMNEYSIFDIDHYRIATQENSGFDVPGSLCLLLWFLLLFFSSSHFKKGTNMVSVKLEVLSQEFCILSFLMNYAIKDLVP